MHDGVIGHTANEASVGNFSFSSAIVCWARAQERKKKKKKKREPPKGFANRRLTRYHPSPNSSLMQWSAVEEPMKIFDDISEEPVNSYRPFPATLHVPPCAK